MISFSGDLIKLKASEEGSFFDLYGSFTPFSAQLNTQLDIYRPPICCLTCSGYISQYIRIDGDTWKCPMCDSLNPSFYVGAGIYERFPELTNSDAVFIEEKHALSGVHARSRSTCIVFAIDYCINSEKDIESILSTVFLNLSKDTKIALISYSNTVNLFRLLSIRSDHSLRCDTLSGNCDQSPSISHLIAQDLHTIPVAIALEYFDMIASALLNLSFRPSHITRPDGRNRRPKPPCAINSLIEVAIRLGETNHRFTGSHLLIFSTRTLAVYKPESVMTDASHVGNRNPAILCSEIGSEGWSRGCWTDLVIVGLELPRLDLLESVAIASGGTVLTGQSFYEPALVESVSKMLRKRRAPTELSQPSTSRSTPSPSVSLAVVPLTSASQQSVPFPTLSPPIMLSPSVPPPNVPPPSVLPPPYIPHVSIESMPHAAIVSMPNATTPHEPIESIPHAPTVSIPHAPIESIPNAPTLSIPHAPVESIPNAPTLSMPHAPTVSIHHGPTVSIPHAPIESISHAPIVSITHAPTVSITHTHIVSIPHAPTVPTPHASTVFSSAADPYECQNNNVQQTQPPHPGLAYLINQPSLQNGVHVMHNSTVLPYLPFPGCSVTVQVSASSGLHIPMLMGSRAVCVESETSPSLIPHFSKSTAPFINKSHITNTLECIQASQRTHGMLSHELVQPGQPTAYVSSPASLSLSVSAKQGRVEDAYKELSKHSSNSTLGCTFYRVDPHAEVIFQLEYDSNTAMNKTRLEQGKNTLVSTSPSSTTTLDESVLDRSSSFESAGETVFNNSDKTVSPRSIGKEKYGFLQCIVRYEDTHNEITYTRVTTARILLPTVPPDETLQKFFDSLNWQKYVVSLVKSVVSDYHEAVTVKHGGAKNKLPSQVVAGNSLSGEGSELITRDLRDRWIEKVDDIAKKLSTTTIQYFASLLTASDEKSRESKLMDKFQSSSAFEKIFQIVRALYHLREGPIFDGPVTQNQLAYLLRSQFLTASQDQALAMILPSIHLYDQSPQTANISSPEIIYESVPPESLLLFPSASILADMGDYILIRPAVPIVSSETLSVHQESILECIRQEVQKRCSYRFPVPVVYELGPTYSPQYRLLYSRLSPSHMDSVETQLSTIPRLSLLSAVELEYVNSTAPPTDQPSFEKFLWLTAAPLAGMRKRVSVTAESDFQITSASHLRSVPTMPSRSNRSRGESGSVDFPRFGRTPSASSLITTPKIEPGSPTNTSIIHRISSFTNIFGNTSVPATRAPSVRLINRKGGASNGNIGSGASNHNLPDTPV